MNNAQVILSALNDYTGTLDSLHDFTAVVQQEVGPDWVGHIYEVMKDLGPVDKERLDHAVSYHCAVLSWDEINGYLTQPNLTPEIAQRLPVMEHWLKFFGDEGLAVVKELRQKLIDAGIIEEASADTTEKETAEQTSFEQEKTAAPNETEQSVDTAAKITETPITNIFNDFSADETNDVDNTADAGDDRPPVQEMETITETETSSGSAGQVSKEPETQTTSAEQEAFVETATPQQPVIPPQETPISGNLLMWLRDKIFKEIAMLDTVQEWIAARCHQLGGLEINEYSYHGFLDDLKRLIAQDIQEVLLHQEGYPLLKSMRADAVEYLTTYRENLEKELQTEDMPTPLTKEQLTKEEMQRTLGGIDTQTTHEYLGPAPDGFEVVDDNSADVQAYHKMEQEIEATSTPDELSPDRTLEKKEAKTSTGLRELFSKIPPAGGEGGNA